MESLPLLMAPGGRDSFLDPVAANRAEHSRHFSIGKQIFVLKNGLNLCGCFDGQFT